MIQINRCSFLVCRCRRRRGALDIGLGHLVIIENPLSPETQPAACTEREGGTFSWRLTCVLKILRKLLTGGYEVSRDVQPGGALKELLAHNEYQNTIP